MIWKLVNGEYKFFDELEAARECVKVLREVTKHWYESNYDRSQANCEESADAALTAYDAATNSARVESPAAVTTTPTPEQESLLGHFMQRAEELERQVAAALAALAALPSWKCRAKPTADPPEDCDWPTCGCDAPCSSPRLN